MCTETASPCTLFPFLQWMIAALFVAMNQLGTESADESREREYYAHLLPCQRAYLSKTAVAVSMATTFLADCIAILVRGQTTIT